MRYLIFLFGLLSVALSAQNSEFTVYGNGLIYSDTTMNQLHHIVDSLNIRFRTCDLHKTYYSKAQARAHFVDMESGNIDQALRDLKRNISFDDFVARYPEAKIEKDLLVTKWKYKDYMEQDVVEFRELAFDGDYGKSLELDDPEEYADKRVAGWVFEYYEGTDYSKESISALFFPEGFSRQPLPEKYARLVQYSECMVDTNAQIYLDQAYESGGYYRNKKSAKIEGLEKYIRKAEGYPTKPEIEDEDEFDEEKYITFYQKLYEWDSLRLVFIRQELAEQPKFQSLLEAAVEDALANGGSNEKFELYVELFYSKEAALKLKRSRRVIGSCSMDQSPRFHAMNIAVLSAETVNWETFLRAHLNIMNDRFERVSDGSYAWAGRQTYIRELEELDINVIDLVLGISLRVENPSQNHYYGSIGRLGRALAETQQPSAVETQMLSIIRDDNLDDYNRLLIYFLYLNYQHYIEDDQRKAQALDDLKIAARALPEYMVDRLNPGK